jgi:type IV pilus assembly protein PilM
MGRKMKKILDIFNLKLEAFGLDISDQALKLVRLEKQGKKIKMKCFNELSLPDDVIQNGVVLKPEILTENIKKLIKKTKGLNLKYVALSLPEEKVFLQVISMPKMKEEELKNAVKYEAENYVPFSIDTIYFDCEPIVSKESKKDSQEVLLAALQKETVDSYLSVLDKSGLSPLILETESQSLARALIKDRGTEIPRLIMDIGAIRTTFIIVTGNAPRFSASIPISANLFTEAISRTLKVDLKIAEELKRSCGLKRQTEKEKEVFDSLVPILADLTDQIKKHLEYYHDYAIEKGFADQNTIIKDMIICGGGSNLIGLDKFLSEQLHIDVQIGDPLVNIAESKKSIIDIDLLSFAVAIGLALRGLNKYD